MFSFQVLTTDKSSRARLGRLQTAHGAVETPAYVMVGTHAAVRTLAPADLRAAKIQIIIANTYHLWRALGRKIENFEGLHKKMNWSGPLMTDSGGFQVFSLGFAREHGVGKIANIFPSEDSRKNINKPEENLARITDEGVYFKDNNEELFLDPERSIFIQEKLGADIILAFDECTSPLHDYAYTRQALKRTHLWAKQCLAARTRSDQALYGIVQGGAFRDLREASAEFIAGLGFDGFAIGGSLGRSREDMFRVIGWTAPYLPAAQPRHLLGIGLVNDLFEAVELGIDTFDCVVPTREARHAALWTKNGRFEITKSRYANDKNPIENDCLCPVCQSSVRRKELHELFKAKDPAAARFATIHNVYFFNDLMRQIREAIKNNRLKVLKGKILREMGSFRSKTRSFSDFLSFFSH